MFYVNNQKGIIPLVVVAIVALIGLGSAGTVLASQNSLPGDTLYPVKSAVQSLQVAFAFSSDSKASEHLAIAEETLNELTALQDKGASADTLQLAAQKISENDSEAQDEVDQAKSDGKDITELIAKLQSNLDRQQSILQSVLNKAPEQAKASIQSALEHSRRGLENAIQEQNKKESSDSGKELKVSEKPRESETPEASESPKASEKPESSLEPKASEKPDSSETPESSASPKSTESSSGDR